MMITVTTFIFKATLRIWFFGWQRAPLGLALPVQECPHYHLMCNLFSLQLKTKPSISLYIFISLQGSILIWMVCVFTSENTGPIEILSASCPQNTKVNHYPDDISVGMHFETYDLFQHCKLLCQFHLFVFYNICDLLTIWTCSSKSLKMNLN